MADYYFLQVMNACETQDEDIIAKLFSATVTQNSSEFAEQVNMLFDFYNGSLVSYEIRGGPISKGGFNDDGNGHSWEALQVTYDVATDSGFFRFALEICVKDTETPDNEGIRSLYVINGEDSDMHFAYWGCSEWEPGIVIE